MEGRELGVVVGGVVIGDVLCGMVLYTFKGSGVFENVGVPDWRAISEFGSD